MSKSNPLVSIGIPVNNGAKYLDQAIESIISQSYTNFELFISDNASTDNTQDICVKWQNIDKRITYHRNEKNQGAIPNFNHLVGKAKGKYFKWAAHDDYLDPDYLAECVATLEENPQSTLCFTWVREIDENNEILKTHEYAHHNYHHPTPYTRHKSMIYNDLDCFEIFGLMRLESLQNTPLFGHYIASDRILLSDLILVGPFTEVKKYLFYNRDHPESSTRKMPAHHQRAAWFDTSKNINSRNLPHWRIMKEYLSSISRANITIKQKWQCRLNVLGWVFRHMNWAWLILDIVLYFYPGAWKFFFKFRKNKNRLDEG
jgi:glycosyltransferase involved in cell wall biosynthesis